MELTYTQCGVYLIPNLVLSDTREYHIGKYGRMRRAYLKEYRPALDLLTKIEYRLRNHSFSPHFIRIYCRKDGLSHPLEV